MTTKEDIKRIVKDDLREHPEKRSSMQFCLACYAYGVDLNEIDKELEHEKIERDLVH